MTTKRRKAIEIVEEHLEDLPVKLADEEVRRKGEELAAAQGELQGHAEHEKEAKATLKSDRAAIEARIQKLAMQIRNKTETRPVEVFGRADYAAGSVTYVRKDTDEEIRRRAMREDERQLGIPQAKVEQKKQEAEEHPEPEKE